MGSSSILEQALREGGRSGEFDLQGMGLDALPHDVVDIAERGAARAAAEDAHGGSGAGPGQNREVYNSARGFGDFGGGPSGQGSGFGDCGGGGFGDATGAMVSTVKLLLQNNALRTLPDAFASAFAGLQHLDLSANSFSSLPAQLARVPLQILVVNRNGLASGGLLELGREASYMAQQQGGSGGNGGNGSHLAATLRTLHLAQNRLDELPYD